MGNHGYKNKQLEGNHQYSVSKLDGKVFEECFFGLDCEIWHSNSDIKYTYCL